MAIPKTTSNNKPRTPGTHSLMARPIEDPDPDSLGGRLLQIMNAKGMSMRKAAAKIGCSQPAVFKWIHGISEPNFATCRLIAAAFNVSPQWLAFGPDPSADPGPSDIRLLCRIGGEDLELSYGFCLTNFKETASKLKTLLVKSENFRPLFRVGETAVIVPNDDPSDHPGLYWVKDARGDRMAYLPVKPDADTEQAEPPVDPDTVTVVGRIVGKINIHGIGEEPQVLRDSAEQAD